MVQANAVEVRDLTVTRGRVRAVDRANLDLPRGSITGLLGPSGSGKTTLMRAVIGSQIIDDGTISVLGCPAGTASIRSDIGYMSQTPALYVDLTVRENLAYFARILNVSSKQVDQVVAQVDIGHRLASLVGSLSGGESNRVSLAVALLNAPALLILDEPTVGLDPVLRRSLWNLFRSLADAGTTLLVSSHVMDEAEHCDRLVLMREGATLFEGSQADLKQLAGAADIESAFIALAGHDRP